MNALIYKAQWMVRTGKTSEDWDNLPISDVKLIMAYLSSEREREKYILGEVLRDSLGR